MNLSTHLLKPSDQAQINQIAEWYFKEWNIPMERTRQRLEEHPNEDVLFQIVLKKDQMPVATGGIYNQVGILNEFPEFRKFRPWLALVYTDIDHRNLGLGNKLLQAIEARCKETGIGKIYLYTFTAESLYLKAGWQILERLDFKGHDTVVMEKEL
ncbi:MAG: GNAT family N-acetyltransferase [Cytophagaceae bacterium]